MPVDKYYCQGCFMFLSDQAKLSWIDASYACEQVMLIGSEENRVRDGLPKKRSCSFGFCPNYLDPPPPPNLDNLYHFF